MIFDTKLAADMREVAQAGNEQAQRPGGCSHWLSNPTAVYEVRRDAENAR